MTGTESFFNYLMLNSWYIIINYEVLVILDIFQVQDQNKLHLIIKSLLLYEGIIFHYLSLMWQNIIKINLKYIVRINISIN